MELPAVPDFLPSPFELGYRNRAQFGVISKKIGFLKRMSGDLVEVEECPLLLPGLNKSVQEFRKAAEASPASFPLGRMFAIEGEKRDVAAEPSPGGRWLSGVTWTVGGISFKCAPEVFFQSNAHLLEPFQALVCDEAGGGHAVDLYGGNGFFALKLARSFKSVTVIEENRAAVALGRESARLAGIGNVRFQVSRVEDVDPETMVPKADLAIVDPPRAGLSNRAMAVLKSMNPRRITYVSCDPTSMARDVRKLAEAGWKLCRVAIADMFPQTYHVETVAFMSRIN
jgi:tRNA/tmRNA/rRNA uracil-C5-methylase (TrmA/RlmC/RlmD family)